MSPWLFFLASSLLAILIQGLFALFEMACVSFNKVRLQYFASIGKKRAIWLCELIQRPSRLFGTTLIGINTSLLVGSECARRFYEALHLNPDFAPLSQVILVVIFGELAPLFSARRHPEQLAMALSPFMILISRILAPLIWAIDMMAKGVHYLIGKPTTPLFLSREEVQKAFEEDDHAKDDFNILVGRMFRMKNSIARQSMVPIQPSQLISSNATLDEARHQLSIRYAPFLLVYHREGHNIVAIAHLRDLLSLEPKKKILDVAKPPWFVTQDASLLQILEQFRRNNQSIAIILDSGGRASGVLSLDQINDVIFGPQGTPSTEEEATGGVYVERTVAGAMTVEQFNREFQAALPFSAEETLSDLMISRLDHLPVKGESLEIGPFEFTVLEPSLRGAKLLSVKTVE